MYNQDLRSTITNIRLRIYQKAESQLWSYRPPNFFIVGGFYNMYQVLLHTRFMVLIYADPDLYIIYHCGQIYFQKTNILVIYLKKKNTIHNTEILTLNVEMGFFFHSFYLRKNTTKQLLSGKTWKNHFINFRVRAYFYDLLKFLKVSKLTNFHR